MKDDEFQIVFFDYSLVSVCLISHNSVLREKVNYVVSNEIYKFYFKSFSVYFRINKVSYSNFIPKLQTGNVCYVLSEVKYII